MVYLEIPRRFLLNNFYFLRFSNECLEGENYAIIDAVNFSLNKLNGSYKPSTPLNMHCIIYNFPYYLFHLILVASIYNK